MATQQLTCPEENRLLAQLSAGDCRAMLANASAVSLVEGTVLYREGESVDAIYFPLDCVISLMCAPSGDSPRLEMASIGSEGAAGLISLFSGRRAIAIDAVEVPGAALKADASAVLNVIETRPEVEKIICRYIFCLMHQIIHVAGCNQMHTMQERCARWLLMTHDRTHRSTFPLTQGVLASVFGVRRATVNQTIGALKAAGYIRYVRGRFTIVNRAGLERAVCPCYTDIRGEYARANLA